MINFRTLNRKLLEAIKKAPDNRKKIIFKKQMNLYRNKMLKNAKTYLNNDKYASNFKYTLDSVERKILKNLDFDIKLLQKQLNRLITNSRQYQEQLMKNDKLIRKIKKSNVKMYEYIITHPITTNHSDECSRDKANSPFTKEQALEVMSRKPNHINCTCTVKEIKQG